MKKLIHIILAAGFIFVANSGRSDTSNTIKLEVPIGGRVVKCELQNFKFEIVDTLSNDCSRCITPYIAQVSFQDQDLNIDWNEQEMVVNIFGDQTIFPAERSYPGIENLSPKDRDLLSSVFLERVETKKRIESANSNSSKISIENSKTGKGFDISIANKVVFSNVCEDGFETLKVTKKSQNVCR